MEPIGTHKRFTVDAGIYVEVEKQLTLIAGLQNAALTVKSTAADHSSAQSPIWKIKRATTLDWELEAEYVYLVAHVDEGPAAGTTFPYAAAQRYLRQAAYGRFPLQVEIRYKNWQRDVGDAVVMAMSLTAAYEGVASGSLKLAARSMLEQKAFEDVVADARDWVYNQTRIIDRSSGAFRVIPDQEYPDDYAGTMSGRIEPMSNWPIIINTPLRFDSPSTFPVPYTGNISGHVEKDPAVIYDDRGAVTPIVVITPRPIPTPSKTMIRGKVSLQDLPEPLESRERITPIMVESPNPVPYNYVGEVRGRLDPAHLPRRNDFTQYQINKYYFSDTDGVRKYVGWENTNDDGTFELHLAASDLSGKGFDRLELRLYDKAGAAFVPAPADIGGYAAFWNNRTQGRYFTQYLIQGANFIDIRYIRANMHVPLMDDGSFFLQADYDFEGEAQLRLENRGSGTAVGDWRTPFNEGKRKSQYRVDLYIRIPTDADYHKATADVYTDGTFRGFGSESLTPIWLAWLIDKDAGEPAPAWFSNGNPPQAYADASPINPLEPESFQYENITVELELWADFIYEARTAPGTAYSRWHFANIPAGTTKVVKVLDTSVPNTDPDETEQGELPPEWKKDPSDPGPLLGMYSGMGQTPRSFNQSPDSILWGTRAEMRTYGYDAALGLLVASGYGDLDMADRYARGIMDMQNLGEWTGIQTDQSFTHGMFLWFTDHWRPVNWWQYYGEPVFRRTIDGWCMYALAKYLDTFGANAAWQQEALDALYACNNALWNYRAPDASFMQGMPYFGNNTWEGPPDWTFIEDERRWQGIEATWEIWHGNNLAYHVTGDPLFRDMRDIAKNFAMNVCWDDNADGSGNGFFWTGAGNDDAFDYTAAGPATWSAGIIPETHLDVWSWGGIFLNAIGETEKSQQLLNTLYRWNAVDVDEHGRRYEGYRAHSPWGGYPGAKEQVWYEGSFGVALWFYKMGWIDLYESLIDKLLPGQWTDGGYLYVVEPDEAYDMYSWPAVGSTAWFPLSTVLKDFMWSETEFP